MANRKHLIELGGIRNGRFERNYYLSLEEYRNGAKDAYVEDLNYTDAYHSIFTYESDEIADANLTAPLFFDLDIQLDSDLDFKRVVRDVLITVTFLESELHIHRDNIEIYFSGSKGFHVLVPFECLGLLPCRDLDQKYKAIAKRVNRETIYKTIDTGIYERRRLFRFSNTINSKTGLYKVPITLKELRSINYKMICEYAKEPKTVTLYEPKYNSETKQKLDRIVLLQKMTESKRTHPKTIISPVEQDALPCVEKLLSTGLGTGSRNNTCVAIASSLAQNGTSREDGTDLLLSWNDLNAPPLARGEVVRTVHSAYQMAEEGRGYGCAFFKDHGHCIGETCKLFKGAHQ